MTLVEISEREVLKKARQWKTWRVTTEAVGGPVSQAEIDLASEVILLEERERVAENLDRADAAESGKVVPLGDVPSGLSIKDALAIGGHRSRKLSRREQEIEKRRRSDPLAADRDDVDYSTIEDPSVR